ncbi:TRAP transporter substrate-binding protein [Bacillus sp. Marseille-P3800]|uniref:TRAP transporter substrate-binding protein n=1 Tax=Bacillus sp. Marseille-P3800 TaxID=2014782 RepID=UPI000C08D562|nr:TRAP transporter substrate-binding protein [Bacillus sp. Marseille-P3800]
MKKSWFVLSFASLVFISGCATITASDEVETYLMFSHFFPPNHEQETVVVQSFIEDIAEQTDGDISIRSFPGGSLAAPDTQYDATATGAVDLGLSVHSYTPGQFPLSSVMELPFMSKSGSEGSRILWQLYEEFPEIQAEYGEVIPLWLYTSEPGQIYTVGQPIERMEDLKGLRIRSPSPEVNAWLSALGATPVSMSMNESYEALDRGVVDGVVGPWHTLLDYSLYEVIDYATVGDFYMSTFYTVMSENSWTSLNSSEQTIFTETAGARMSLIAGENFDKRTQEAQEAAQDANVSIYELPEDELTRWRTHIDPVIDQWIDRMEHQGLPGRQVYERALELSDEEEIDS